MSLAHLRLSAVAVAVATAVSSGAAGLEAVAVAGEQGASAEDLDIIGDLGGAGVPVWSSDPSGQLRAVVRT